LYLTEIVLNTCFNKYFKF